MIVYRLRKLPLVFIIILHLAGLSFSESRFLEHLFKRDELEETGGIVYSQPSDNKVSYLKLDLIMPSKKKDSLKERPLVIMMHGGGYVSGSRKSWQVTDFNYFFASLGYVCASIDYTLGSGRDSVFFKEAIVNTCSDLNKALSFLLSNSKEYNIDTSKVIAGGFSAGAVTALHFAYLDYNKTLTYKNGSDTSSIYDITPCNTAVKAVINFWGCIKDPSWLKNAKVPIYSIHGERDKLVDINCGKIYGSSNMPVCCGGNIIHGAALENSIPSKLYTFRAGHGEISRIKLTGIYEDIAIFLFNSVLR